MSIEDQADRMTRALYDIYAKLSRLDSELSSTSSVSVLKKKKIQSSMEKTDKELEQEFMRTIREFADLFRKEQRSIIALLPKLQSIKPDFDTSIAKINFPSIAAGDMNDFNALFDFASKFAGRFVTLRQGLVNDVQHILDENKRILETYERHVTIDRSKVTTTASLENVLTMSIPDLITTMEKLRSEREYLDGRSDEVRRMIGAALLSDIESLQSSTETATRFGLDIPIDYTKLLRNLAKEAAQATDLTTLISLESQIQSAKMKLANMLKDKIINIKHEITNKVIEGGLKISSELIPEAPIIPTDETDVAALLTVFQKMVSWSSQVKVGLRDVIAEILEDIERATEHANDAGITDIIAVREFLAHAQDVIKEGELDSMIEIYHKAYAMNEEYRKNITDKIREYLARFNELATSADRVLDYAQLSKKAPKVEELKGSIVYLIQALSNLREAVEKGVATFREAALQEIDAIIEDLQTIKPAYAEIFTPIIVSLEEASQRIEKMDDFTKIKSEMRGVKDSILMKAKDALENLRYRLHVKIRLAAAKLMGAGVTIPKEVQEAISELNSIGVAAETVFSLPAIARKMIELYEKKITDRILELLAKESKELLDSFENAQSIGVNLAEEMIVLNQIVNEPPKELEAAADAFDKIQNITTSAVILDKIRERANVAYSQLEEALTIFERQGMSEFVSRLKVLLKQAAEQLEKESTHINDSLQVCLTLAQVQNEMIGVIKEIAKKDAAQFDKEIRSKSKYYSTIERVFEEHPDEFSALIYNVKKIQELERQLEATDRLDMAIQYFNELKELRSGWLEKAVSMDDWHKSLRMYMTGFSPTASTEERKSFLEEKVKLIKETYSREDIRTYLSWALLVIADTYVESRT